MFIVKLLRFLKGYVKFSAGGVFIERFFNLAVHHGVPIWDAEKKDTEMAGCTPAKSYRRLRPYARRTHVHLRVTERHGLPFWLRRYRRRIGLGLGAVLFIAFLFGMGNFIWDIEVEGCAEVSEGEVLDTLAEQGMRIGAFIPALDARDLERTTLLSIKRLAWIAVNITGSTVTVEVRERTMPPEMYLDDDKPCNIVARATGHILSIDVYDGMGMIRAGDTVMEGDLIVSGIIEDAKGKTRIKHARAKVVARAKYTAQAEVPMTQTVREPTGQSDVHISLKAFSAELPLFWKRETEQPYELCRTMTPVSFLGFSTPFAICRDEIAYYREKTIQLTETEAKEQAIEKLGRIEEESMEDIKILSRQLAGKKEGGVYRLTAEYQCEMEIGREQEILINS
ncbi:MAG: sporulation protein YqfD [Oscillospiraceae bacterium]|nr:sporulation protein YqfD [Oscillospiraceae bacterium]